MLLLTIDTALRNCNIVLSQNAKVLHELVWGDEVKHSSRVLEAVDVVLTGAGVTLNDLDGFGVTVGPGSFTGLRIGMSTVKGLALALNKPVAGICVLHTLARQAMACAAGLPITAMLDGSKNEVFVRRYAANNGELEPLTDYLNLDYQAAAKLLTAPVVLTGNGVPLVEPYLSDNSLNLVKITDAEIWAPLNQSLAEIAWGKFQTGETLNGGAVIPNYIRRSDAEINLAPKN